MRFIRLLAKFWRKQEAVVAVEAAFVFPLLVAILCGMMDIGQALVINQKTITATQTIADLLAREEQISNAEMTDAIVAGRLSMQPYDVASYGADVVGIQFVGTGLVPTERWRDTVGTEENDQVFEMSEGLGARDEGVIAVTVDYFYVPYFTSVFVDGFEMQEMAFARGRRGLFVERVP